jgi:hypothetical protein
MGGSTSGSHWRSLGLLAAAGAMVLVTATPASADTEYLTPQVPYLTLTGDGTVTAIINSGDVVDGVEFAGIPDGVGIVPGDGTVDVYVAHEETTVPFFNSADFQDSSVTKLTLNTITAGVLGASIAISPELGYLRFCSAAMAGPAEGFSTYTFFTGEETNDVVDVPAGAPFGADPAVAPQRQGGYAVALNTETGESAPIPGMGRLNHENTIALPGYNQIAMLTTDDTFSAGTSQLYLYLANQESHVWQDKGSLWAFQVTRTDDGAVDQWDPFNGANDYLDIQPGDDWQGKFIRVPKEIARGTTDLAPQDALEQWSNENNVFQFIRLEDAAYDKNDPSVVYVADTGGTRIVPDPTTGRMLRGPGGTVGQADNGRVFRFEFDAKNPRKVASFSVLADGDASGSPAYVPFTSPDNLDTSANSLMVQEDTDFAQIWRHDYATGTWTAVADVADTGGESSGIVDASSAFGSGSWLVTVQAHGFPFVASEQVGDVLYKREAGQLVLMTIPGS